MKKISFLLLAVLLCLLLTACGKTEAVKHLEAQIEAIEEVTSESGDALAAIEAAYEALTEEEKKTVKNYADFLSRKDSYDELRLPGVWHLAEISPNRPESIFAPQYSLSLNADMTCAYEVKEEGRESVSRGEWKVENGEIVVTGIQEIHHPYGSSYFHEGMFTVTVGQYGGKESLLMRDELSFVRGEDYFALLDGVIRKVDCANEPLNDYFSFSAYESLGYDEWGVRNGTDYTHVHMTNGLFDEGWYYIGASEDFALEILYPAHDWLYTYHDGSTSSQEVEAGSYTVKYHPFSIYGHELMTRWTFDSGVGENTLDLNDISIGRAKGEMYFINSEYIAEVCNEDNARYLVVDHNAESEQYFIGTDRIWVGEWEEKNQDY